jgi:hypothetical protein
MTEINQLLSLLKAEGVIPCNFTELFNHLMGATTKNKDSIGQDIPESNPDEALELTLMRKIAPDKEARKAILYTIAKITSVLSMELFKDHESFKDPAYMLLLHMLISSFHAEMTRYIDELCHKQLAFYTNEQPDSFRAYDRHSSSNSILFLQLSMLLALSCSANIIAVEDTKRQFISTGCKEDDQSAINVLNTTHRALDNIRMAVDQSDINALLERIKNKALMSYELYTSFHLGITIEADAKVKNDLLVLVRHTLPGRSDIDNYEDILADQNKRGVLAAIQAMGSKLTLKAVNGFIYTCIEDVVEMDHPHPSYLSMALNVWSNIAQHTPLMRKLTASIDLLLVTLAQQVTDMHQVTVPMRADASTKTCQHLFMAQKHIQPFLDNNSDLCSYYLRCAEITASLNPSFLDSITITGGKFNSVGLTPSGEIDKQNLARILPKVVKIDPNKVNHKGGRIRNASLWLSGKEPNRLPCPNPRS